MLILNPIRFYCYARSLRLGVKKSQTFQQKNTAQSGTAWAGTWHTGILAYRYFLGLLDSIPPLLFWEIAYRSAVVQYGPPKDWSTGILVKNTNKIERKFCNVEFCCNLLQTGIYHSTPSLKILCGLRIFCRLMTIARAWEFTSFQTLAIFSNFVWNLAFSDKNSAELLPPDAFSASE